MEIDWMFVLALSAFISGLAANARINVRPMRSEVEDYINARVADDDGYDEFAEQMHEVVEDNMELRDILFALLEYEDQITYYDPVRAAAVKRAREMCDLPSEPPSNQN